MSGVNEIREVPKVQRGEIYTPERPSLKRLAELNGEPPWALVVPDTGILPEEATDLVGAIVWRGVTFERKVG